MTGAKPVSGYDQNIVMYDVIFILYRHGNFYWKVSSILIQYIIAEGNQKIDKLILAKCFDVLWLFERWQISKCADVNVFCFVLFCIT